MFHPPRARLKAKPRRAGGGRLAITLFALLAFTFQTFVAQVHIHPAPWGGATAFNAGKDAQPGKLPPSDDQSSCPICQVILHAGQFITPSAIAFGLPSVAVFLVASFNLAAPATQAASHSWQGRAPPRI